MGSSLNTDQDQDVMVLNYPEHDVCCKAIPNHGGRLNMRQTSCDAKLAMEEIPASCRKCKKIKQPKVEVDTEAKAEALRDYNRIHQQAYRALHKPVKQYTCKKCGIDVPVRHKHCVECKKVVKKESHREQWRKQKPISAID